MLLFEYTSSENLFVKPLAVRGLPNRKQRGVNDAILPLEKVLELVAEVEHTWGNPDV